MLVIFIAAYIGGTGLSSTAGAVLPVIYSFTSGVSPMIIGVYALVGPWDFSRRWENWGLYLAFYSAVL